MLSKKIGGLEFKDLHSFNLAMLAKQGWRLIKNEDALVTRSLKAKYFANEELKAQVGSNPSYNWRSIFEDRIVLEKGLV